MISFLQFLLFLFIIFVVIIGTFVFKIYRQIHHQANQFRQQMKDTFQQQSASQGTGSSSDKDSNQEVIIDKRNPKESNKKIFSEKEGEYVDFKEDE